ncbi:poly-beta-1,6 N-acetyl-D-glucosamine export porin PgaA [Lysobacter sp. A289]
MPNAKYLSLLIAFAVVGSLHASPQSASVAPAAGASLSQIDAMRSRGHWLGALSLIESGLALQPDSPALIRLKALSLLDLGSSHRAWMVYRNHPALFDADQITRLESAQLARLIVWGGLYAESTKARAQEMQLAEDAMRARIRQQDGDDLVGSDLRTRLDQVVLYNQLEQHADAVAAYQALVAEQAQVPPYVLLSAGESLLAERQPEQAAVLLEQALAALPGEHDAKLLLAYAYSESEHFDRAIAYLEQQLADEPAWQRVADAKLSHPNWRHYDFDTNLALIRLYGHDTEGAQERLEKLARIGPNNAGLQSSLGAVYQQRGWPERALERFRISDTLDPNHIGAQLGQIGSLLDLQRVDLARPLHTRLLDTHPLNVQVMQMQRDWDNHLGWQWQLGLASGRSDSRNNGAATASPLGSRGGEYRFAIQSPLLADRWRLTAQARDAWADYQGERVHDRRTGVGVAYAFDRLQATAGVNRANDTWVHDRTGYHVDAGWRFSDTWAANAGWSGNTPDASLQARRAGIGADALSLGVSWVPSEQARMDLSAQQLRYEDGNRRDALSVDAERRLLTQPHLLLDGLLSAYTSRGSLDDVPYFNPARDASLRLGARLDHLTWRRYNHHFRQRVTASVGPYWQRDHSSAWVPELRYEHEWRFGTGRSLQYGIGWSRPVYDGVREEHLGFDLAFGWGE